MKLFAWPNKMIGRNGPFFDMEKIDSLTHVTENGRWFGTSFDASVEELLRQMDEVGIEKSVIVGMDGYISNKFILDVSSQHRDRLIPFAGFNPAKHSIDNIGRVAREELLNEGFSGVKLHPRLGKFDPLCKESLAFFEELNSWGDNKVPVWLCSFLTMPGVISKKGAVGTISELAYRFQEQEIVFLHGGCSEILSVAQAVRSFPNVYIDISYTLVKYKGSSIDLDIKYLLNTFDERIIFGSDFPEISLPAAYDELDLFLHGVKTGVAHKICRLNIENLLFKTCRIEP